MRESCDTIEAWICKDKSPEINICHIIRLIYSDKIMTCVNYGTFVSIYAEVRQPGLFAWFLLEVVGSHVVDSLAGGRHCRDDRGGKLPACYQPL